MIYDSILIGRCLVRYVLSPSSKGREKKKEKTIEAILDFTTWQRPLGSLIFMQVHHSGHDARASLLSRCFNDH